MRATAPLLSRVLQEDTVIHSYHIPAGVGVSMLFIYLPHDASALHIEASAQNFASGGYFSSTVILETTIKSN